MTIDSDATSMRWDLIESQPPTGERFTARLAVPSQCEEVFIAVDAASHRFTLVRIPDGEPCSIVERATRGIAVETVEMKVDSSGGNRVFVEIACLEQSGYAALDIITLELVDALVAGSSIGRVRLVQGVLTKWRRFWSDLAQNVLSRQHHLGLFGELWFLAKWLLPAIGVEGAVAMWRGPVGARHDFEQRRWAVEVKTSSKLDGTHQINGLEQLLEPTHAELFLFSLLVREEASSAVSLPELIAELRCVLARDYKALSQFDAMLVAAGYDDAYAGEYCKLKLRVRSQCLYRVLAGFPRIVPASIQGGLPAGISNVSYYLRLDAATNWLVGEAPSAAATLFKGLAKGGAD